MHSPISRSRSKPVADGFTEEEISLFEGRFEDGYDLTHDARYNRWLSQYHPESTVRPLPLSSSAVSSFLNYPPPPTRQETFKPKSCGRVLTSAENFVTMAEKEREKERKKEEKERRKEERERKKKEREEATIRKTLLKSQCGMWRDKQRDSMHNTLCPNFM